MAEIWAMAVAQIWAAEVAEIWAADLADSRADPANSRQDPADSRADPADSRADLGAGRMVSASTTRLPQSALAPTTTAIDGGFGGATRLRGAGRGGGGGGGGGKGSKGGGGDGGGGGGGVEEAEGVAVEVGVVPGVGASVAAVEVVEAVAEVVEAAAAVVEAAAAVVEVAAAVVLVELREWYAGRGRSGGAGPCTYVLCTGERRGETCGLSHTAQCCFGRLTDAWRAQFPDAVELLRWGDLLRQNVAIFDLDFDAILAAMYSVTDSAESDCYLSVPPDLDIEAAALGASASVAPGTGESAALGVGESALSGIAPTEALHTFTLDSGASRSFFRDSTTLTLLSWLVAVSLADPSGGPVLAHSSTVLPCPAAPSGLLSGLHLPSFSMNLVSGADLQDVWVDQFTSGGQRVTHFTCSRTGRHLATFTRRPGSSLYTLTTASPPVSASSQVAASNLVFAAASRSSPEYDPCSCRPLSHETLLWHRRLGHPSLPRLQARVRGQGHERYFLLVVDDYSRYTTVFPLRSKGDVIEGVRQTFTLPASSLKNGFAERRIGMVMDVARTSMIHATAPHFMWPFAVQYAAHQINLQPRVSLPETTPTLRWTGKVGDASVFHVWGSPAFVHDTSTNKLSSRAVPCIFRSFPLDAPGWQFYHPTSCRVLSSQDVTFDDSGPAPSGVSQVDPAKPVEVDVDSGAAWGAEPAGAGTGGAKPGVSVSEGAEPGGAELERVEPGGAEPGGAESGSAEPGGDEPERGASGGPPGVPSRREPLSPQQLREWYARRCREAAGATGAADAAGGGGAGGAAGGAAGAKAAGGASGAAGGAAGGTGAIGSPAGVGAAGGAGAAGLGGARTGGTGAAGAGGAAEVGATGAGAVATGGAAGAGAAGGTGAGGAAGVVAGDPRAEGTGAVSAVTGGAARPQPYYVPLLQQPTSTLPGPSPYSRPTRGLTERREPESHPALFESRSKSPVRTVRVGRCVSRPCPPPVPGTHSMTVRPSNAPQRVPLPSPPASSLRDGPDSESDSLSAASPTVTRFLATAVTDHFFESTAASALVTELVDFAAACRLDFATSLVAESASASVCPPSVGGECALGTDVLEDRQEDFECFAAAVPSLMSMLLAPEGDPDATDILTPRSYTEAITGPYSSHWQAATDAKMASWKSTGTYVDEVPPPGANIVDGMWIFRVKRPPGSPPALKARYITRGLR
ncbi:unnamed protein product [Closterium sp. NIES-54]